jgi:hypothetical protein
MRPENEQFLQDNYHHWQSVRDTQTLRLLDGPTRQKMVDVMREEWQPGYQADLWCPPCVFDMITAVYSRFDSHMASKKKDEPLKVQTGFPKNDKPEEKLFPENLDDIQPKELPEVRIVDSTTDAQVFFDPNKKKGKRK